MKKIFIDTNVLLDVFLNREAFVDASASVFADCESGKVKGVVSAISLNNLHYILSRHIGKDKALEAVRIVLNVFSVVPVDEKILRLAADLAHKDFEDTIQLYSALQIKADCIITRDASHFPKNELPILSPSDLFGDESLAWACGSRPRLYAVKPRGSRPFSVKHLIGNGPTTQYLLAHTSPSTQRHPPESVASRFLT